MKNESLTDAILASYEYEKQKPILSTGQYSVFNGTNKDTNVPVTIKILRQYHLELPKYLKKIKDCKSDNVIKVYETMSDSGNLVFITERVRYSNLGNALKKCKKLDDSDSVFVTKMILNGHIDLLRSDCNWFGSEEDIEITDNGIKLSWNNSISYNLVNPLPKIFQRISQRSEDQLGDSNLLPFPKNKIMDELIRISKENASEISLNPQVKKKEKMVKKKQKNWIALKEYKNKNQYFNQISYLAVSEEHGFVKVKIFDVGKVNQQILALNKSKNTFTKVLECYEEKNKTVFISQYSNDGNLQAYVTKLKTSGITLSEEHIEFFFYSMFEPLKQIQESALKSINMLHIKNIYIENGIPKIGEPIPLNRSIEDTLVDRSQVPDFYHASFKKNPSTHAETFDTYSLGVLLYKLMYTQYPIFPNGKVHIPTTPNYNKRLKKTLQIFLNEGGKLKDIESKIEVSENVLKQVKQNKQKLIIENKSSSRKKDNVSKLGMFESQKDKDQENSLSSQSQNTDGSDSNEEEEKGESLLSIFCAKLELSPGEEKQTKNKGVIGLEESHYRYYRICSKIILTSLVYLFVFYFFFLRNNIFLIANQDLLIEYDVTVTSSSYKIITTDANKFDTAFANTSGSFEQFLEMKCLLNNYEGKPNYSEILHDNSGIWIGYIISSLFAMIAILLIKMWQIFKFDLVRVIYNKQHAKNRFNLANYIVFHFQWTWLIYGHYTFYNYVFNGYTEPCAHQKDIYAAPYALFNNYSQFRSVYLLTFILQIVVVLLHCLMIGFTHKIKYNKLLNPIVIFLPLMLLQWIFMRIGAVDGYFYPNFLQNSEILWNYFEPFDYVNFFGTFPETLVFLTFVFCLAIDVGFWACMDKSKRKLIINQQSFDNFQNL